MPDERSLEDKFLDALDDNECYVCGTLAGLRYTEDPFAAEINDDYTMHWMCEDCYDMICMEI